jgi:hypothetical protein
MPRFDLAGNPLPDDPAVPPVRYDLAGNPIAPISPPSIGRPQPGQQPNYPNPLTPTASHIGISADQLVGTRPSDGLAERIMDNSSGALDDVPPEVEKLHWNWGAFLVPSFWALNHGMKPLAFAIWGLGIVLHFAAQVQTPLNTALGVVYTVFCLVVSLWLGLFGNKIAWRIRRFEGGLDEFFAVQKAWMIGGVCVAVCSIFLGGKITPGIALYPLHNITRPVNADKTDYEIFYGGKPPL